MKEKDNIAEFLKNAEIKSFDIKQEWLDDMSAQLDAYNSEKKKRRFLWWFLLIPLIGIFPIISQIKNPEKIKKQYASRTFETVLKVNEYEENEFNSLIAQENSLIDSIEEKQLNQINHSILSKQNASLKLLTSTKSSQKFKVPVAKINDTKNLSPGLKKNVEPDLPSTVPILSMKLSDNSSTPSPDSDALNPIIDLPQQNSFVFDSPTRNNIKLDNNLSTNNTKPSEKTTSEQNLTSDVSDNVYQKPNIKNDDLVKEKNDTSEEAELDSIETHSKSNEKDQSIIKLTENDIQVMDNPDTINLSIDSLNLDEEITLDKDGDKQKLWFAGFSLGPDLLEKQLFSTSDQQNFQQKKKEEIISNTWGFNFELGRYLTPWLTIASGVEFKKYKEINSYSSVSFTTYDTTYTFVDNSYYIWDTFVDPSDTNNIIIDTVLVTDTMTVTTVNSNTKVDSSKKVANGPVTSSYFLIPLSTQLIFVSTERLTGYTHLGLSIGVLTKNSGVVIDYNTNDIITYKSRELIFNSTIGVGFNYKLFGPLDYKIYGAYQFNLTNLSVAPNIDKRYNGFNFRTGLVLHF